MNTALDIPVKEVQIFNIEDYLATDTPYLDANAEQDLVEQESYKLFEHAVALIKTIRRSYITTVASSFGKDSTLTLLAALQAHIELMEEGVLDSSSVFLVTTIDTKVESHLMQILVSNEIKRLNEFALNKNINIQVMVSEPNLSRLWASMFLSGLKLLSTSRLNNDCSEELKVKNAIKTERYITKKYGEKVVTLLGSRVQESIRRSTSLHSKNQVTKTADELVTFAEGSRKERVFAPIVTMSDENVWFLLRRAGTTPITPPSEGYQSIPSYADNHRLLDIIYGDATDGSCPVSSKRIEGDTRISGGCGGSRMGCFTCIKPLIDKSSELQSRFKRHSVINGNMLKVRNYMMEISQDLSHRTWHTRAVDFSTGGIAAQPNVLNGPALDKLIILMCQVSADEIIRAKSFKTKVNVGDEMLDDGYADIMNDTTMETENRDLFAKVYKEFAINPLVQPMTFDIAVYLSSIHSRDGVKLPMYRAIYLYQTLVTEFIERVEELTYPEWDYTKQAYNNNFKSLDEAYKLAVTEYEEQGKRIPYPDSDPTRGKVDDIPDAVMLIPDYKMEEYDHIPHTDGMDIERAEGCMIDSRLPSTKLPYKLAKRLLSDKELSALGERKNSDLIEISGFTVPENETLFFAKEPRKKKIKKAISFRKIKKASRTKSSYKVIDKGRTSLDKPSFGYRDWSPAIDRSVYSKHQVQIIPNVTKIYEPFMNLERDSDNAYNIDHNALLDWMDYDGLELALEQHNRSIASAKATGNHIYYYSGPAAFESLMRWGVLDINDAGKRTSMDILKRTAYFRSLGLFRLDDQKFAEFASQNPEKASFTFSDFIDTKTCAILRVKKILGMKEYRSFKARHLVSVTRTNRNKNRKLTKTKLDIHHADPVNYALKQVETFYEDSMEEIIYQTEKATHALLVKHNGLFDYSGMASRYCSVSGAYLRYMSSYLKSLNDFLEVLPAYIASDVKVNISLKSRFNALLDQTQQKVFTNISSTIDKTVAALASDCSSKDFTAIDDFKSQFCNIEIKPSFDVVDAPAQADMTITW